MEIKNALKSLPAFLQVTDEQIALSNEIQEKARQAMYGRVQANQEEARLVRGIHAERAARAQLEVLGAHKRRRGRANAIRFQMGRLADAYADQGRYDEAAKAHPEKTRAREFAAIQKAIERPDDDHCGCPAEKEVQDPATGKTLRIPQENKVEDVFSPKHGRMMPLVACACGDLNVKPLPAVLARREALMMVATAKGKATAADVDVLK